MFPGIVEAAHAIWDGLAVTITNGIVIGAVIMIAYKTQKVIERREMQHELASQLHLEVSRIIANPDNPYSRIGKPTMMFYRGLVRSGNIRFFHYKLQNILYALQQEFKTKPLSASQSRHATESLKWLEKMQEINKHHWCIWSRQSMKKVLRDVE